MIHLIVSQYVYMCYYYFFFCIIDIKKRNLSLCVHFEQLRLFPIFFCFFFCIWWGKNNPLKVVFRPCFLPFFFFFIITSRLLEKKLFCSCVPRDQSKSFLFFFLNVDSLDFLYEGKIKTIATYSTVQ